MENMQEIVKLAVDNYKGQVENYSTKQANDVLRQALIDANNGKTSLSYKDVRNGSCNGLFALVEEILNNTIVEGLQGDEFFNALVDFRNVALGDQNKFLVEDNNLFVVAEISEGNQGIRRQRLGEMKESAIPTSLKAVRVYEELNRVLAGRVDFNKFIDKVAESFRKQLLDDIYALWTGATAAQMGGATYFPSAGDYSEANMLSLIEHVEAAAGGKKAVIVGTKAALRYLAESIQSNAAKDELHNLGLNTASI